MMISRRIALVLATILLPTIVGCEFSDRATVYPVRGTIRLEGKRLTGGGSIAFIPLEKQHGKAAGGQIHEDGTYELNTYSTGDGSIAGYFRVIIMQEATAEPDSIPDGEAMPRGGLQPIATVSAEDIIPALYGDPTNSPLKATVEPRSNEINFDLQRNLQVPGNQMPNGLASNPHQGTSRSRTEGERLIAGWRTESLAVAALTLAAIVD